ncbi:MAG TPA: DNA polymerase III subunit alpha, partial [Gemmatimonadaceae bacterium]|nr:DNA polymerase III subunit alpha [Gemmatimonadaceae bacterium]
ACEAAATLVDIFGGRVAIECWDHGLERERAITEPLIAIARALSIPWVVTNDVHYAEPGARAVHDVLSALRHQRPLAEMGTRLRPNGEWYLKSPSQVARRWQQRPEGVRATRAVAERCTWRMAQLEPTLPAFPLPPGVSADEYLARLVEQGAHERWPRGRTPAHDRQLAHELAIIAKLRLAGYFLIVWDIVRFSRRAGVLCQGRGSAANSAVCFCLGITAVDPVKLGLLFERFLSEERDEAPDIDIDFAHRDREQVLQYVYERYGREHAAMVCEQISYRGRSAIRDACRVLGFSTEQADELALRADRFSAKATGEALEEQLLGARRSALGREEAERIGGHLVSGTEVKTRLARLAEQEARDTLLPTPTAERRAPSAESRAPSAEPRAPSAERPLSFVASIVGALHHVPRHRSIHVGGFVLTEEPLGSIVPIEPASMPGRTVIQWDKDDVAATGLVKIDLLGLGMLTLIQDCLLYIRRTRGVTLELADLDCADPAVYDDLGRADTVGIFQVESRAQMNTLPRLRPRCFYDLVVEVALIRPGPIQGEMVHPYLRRRAGLEPVTYPHPSLEPILARTLGVPLFQEQGMQVAIAAAGFTAAEADVLRRAMGHKRSHEKMAAIAQKMLDGMRRNGIAEDVARRIFAQIDAFADYGFPESHAASFALLVYASAYLKHYYAPEYTAAILNAQPMGFYSPGTLIEDARRHGVEVRPVDVSISGFETTLEAALGARRAALPTPYSLPSAERRAPSPVRRAPSPVRRALPFALGCVSCAGWEAGLANGSKARSRRAAHSGPSTTSSRAAGSTAGRCARWRRRGRSTASSPTSRRRGGGARRSGGCWRRSAATRGRSRRGGSRSTCRRRWRRWTAARSPPPTTG